MLSIKELADYINVDNVPEFWEKYYNVALETFDENWISVDDINNILEFYQFDLSFKENLFNTYYLINNDANLNFLVYLWYYIMFLTDSDIDKWGSRIDYFNNHGSFMMPIFSVLMGYKIHERSMFKFDAEQKQIQLGSIRSICYSNRNGMRFSTMEWASRFIKGQVVGIGILQFQYKKGFLDGEDVIYIHIPKDVSFTKENIDYALNNKDRVFNYFPISKDISFITLTWLLSKDLKDILAKDSNILYFQSKFEVLKEYENEKYFVKYVFDDPFFILNYKDFKEETSLQRGLKRKLLNGEKLHISLGILK